MKMTLCIITVSILLTHALTHAQNEARFVDLSDAEASTTHDNGGRCPAAVIIDGDEETVWSSGGHDHTELPANLFITLSEPTPLASIELLTDDSKNCVRLTHIEVYAAVGDGWALLGSARDNDRLRFTIELTPARVERLRLRVRDTAREDHAWPRIHEVRLLAADAQAAVVELKAGKITDETRAEAMFVARALGLMPELPETQYDPARGYLWYVRSFADTMIAHGTDSYGELQGPMFVSILDCRDQRHPGCVLPPIEGQRQYDRALFGGNLLHDVPLLVALEDMTRLTGEDKYRQAARAYLQHFLDNCTNTPTGLWPWGEHAHWDFYKDAPGNTTHEHLGLAPLSFWETAWELAPDAVLREANGCLNHIVNLETFDFNRHADISQPLPVPRENIPFLDFPRHGAFYLYLWSFAYASSGDGEYLEWVGSMMDHFEANTHAESGLMRMATEDRDRTTARLGTSVSAGLTMLQAAPLLGDTDEGRRCEAMGRRLIGAVAALPHKLDERQFLKSAAYEGAGAADRLRWQEPGFAAHYGGGTFLGTQARMWALAWRLTGEQRCLEIATAMAAYYAEADFLPEAKHTRAQVFGTLVNLMLDLHEMDGGDQWLPAAETYAQQAIGKLYYDGLFRGATGLHYYESELWVSNLAQALVRLHAVTTEGTPDVEPLFFAR